MKDGTMSSAHNIKTKGSVKMKKSISIWMPVLLAVLWLAAPVTATAAGSHPRTVLKKTPRTFILAFPNILITEELKADDPGIIIKNEWYCLRSDWGSFNERNSAVAHDFKLASSGDSKMKIKINDRADKYLNESNKNAERFWADFGISRPSPWKVNVAPGKEDTVSWLECYNKQELEAAKREAIRWARYVKKMFPVIVLNPK